MAIYDAIINRAASNDPLIPVNVSNQVLTDIPRTSAVLQLARRVTMPAGTVRMPVAAALPSAFFVSGDTGLKQTTEVQWSNLELVAEELAVIVPIPEAYLADSQVPIWDNVRPLITEAFGRAIDQATLFGTNKPSTWGPAVVAGAIAAGNAPNEGSGADLAVEVAELGRLVEMDGYEVNGFASGPGLQWRLVKLRSTDGVPIYSSPREGVPGTLYGMPLGRSMNGAWNNNLATLIAGDWTKAILGVRQDITYKLFTEGVISDAAGNVVLNLMQQDSVALRVVMRVAWQVANPNNPVNSVEADRFPFAVLEPTGS